MKPVAVIFVLLAAAACAGVVCQPSVQSDAILCQSALQSAAMSVGETQAVTFVTSYTPGSCECAFLPSPDADITCCTDETWAPVATAEADGCLCTFTSHVYVPPGTFVFYACADTVT